MPPSSQALDSKDKIQQGYFHPCVRLFNAERLYYLLIQSFEAVPEDRNALSGWLRDCRLDKNSTIDIIFGEADLLLRVWSDTLSLQHLLQKFSTAGQHQFRVIAVLLVNDMDVIYQRHLERSTYWDWQSLENWLDKLRIAGNRDNCYPDAKCLKLPSSAREVKNSKQLVRFWVICDGPNKTQWQSFDSIRNFVLGGVVPSQYGVPQQVAADGSNRAETGRRQLAGVSIYSYEAVHGYLVHPNQQSPIHQSGRTDLGSTVPNEGFIIKGEFELTSASEDPKYQNLMENFSYFVHQLRSTFGVRTITYLCARHLLHEREFHPTPFVEISNRRHTIVYNILKTPASLSYKLDNIAIPSHLSLEREHSLNAREERIISAIEAITSTCFKALRVYHPAWWEHIAHARDIFGWLATGNNEALMGTMSVNYPAMESRLRALLRETGHEISWLEKQETDLRKVINSTRKHVVQDESLDIIYKKLRGAIPREKHITYKGLEESLQDLAQEISGSPSETDDKVKERDERHLSLLIEALKEARTDRNRLLHGDVTNLFTEYSSQSSNPEPIWHSYVINYLRLFLSLPLGEAVIKKEIDKRNRIRQDLSEKQKKLESIHVADKIKRKIFCFNWPEKGRSRDSKLTHTLELLRDHYDLCVVPNDAHLLKGRDQVDRFGDIGVTCKTFADLPAKLEGWAISFCNSNFFQSGMAEDLAGRGLKVAWGNELMVLQEGELSALRSGVIDVLLYVSEVQKSALDALYHEGAECSIPEGVVVGSYVNPVAFSFRDRFSEDVPQPNDQKVQQLVVGRLSRADDEKFPENFPQFYSQLGLVKPEFRVMDWNAMLRQRWARSDFRGKWKFFEASKMHPRDFLQSLDLQIFSVGSQYREAYGRVIVEGMLTGAIPLVPKGEQHYLAQLVAHGECGFVCHSDDDFGYHARLLESDLSLRRKMSTCAAEYARTQHCDAAKHVQVWRSVFDR